MRDSRPSADRSKRTRTAPGQPPVLRDQPLAAADLALFTASLARVHPVDGAALEACLDHCSVRVLARGAYLLRAGELAMHAGLLLDGLLREYFLLEDGTERTKAFALEGDPTGSLADLLSGQGSRAYIVAEEPARVALVPFQRMLALAQHFPAWKQYNEGLLRILFLRKAEREYELLGLDATQRYQAFLRKFPRLSARVKARHVASYLGITPVHLSRLRSRARRAR